MSSSTRQGISYFLRGKFSSISAINGSGYQVAYSTAMAAISGMTLPIARALGRYGIRCVGIQPGLFDIPEIQDYADTISVLSKMSPFPRRLGSPEEFAKLVVVKESIYFSIDCYFQSDAKWMQYEVRWRNSIFTCSFSKMNHSSEASLKFNNKQESIK